MERVVRRKGVEMFLQLGEMCRVELAKHNLESTKEERNSETHLRFDFPS